MASQSTNFRYPAGVIPGNVEHLESNSHKLHHGFGLHHVFEVTIPIIMGIFVILFFMFTTFYLGFSLIRLYYSDTLKPYKTKTLKSLGKHRHYYVGGESVSYITEGTRKSSLSLSKIQSKLKKSRRFGDNSKQTSAASTARRSEVSLKPGEPTPDFILLPRDLPVLSRFPSGRGMQKFYTGSSSDATRRISTSGLLTNRKGHPWEWDQEWYPKSSMNRSEHRKSLDMLRSTHGQLQVKTEASFPQELARSEVSVPELTVNGEVMENSSKSVLMPVVTEATPETSEQNVPPSMSSSEPIQPPMQRLIASNVQSGRGGKMDAATSISKSLALWPGRRMPTRTPSKAKPAGRMPSSNATSVKSMPVASKDISVASKDISVASKDISVASKDISVASQDNSVASQNISVASQDISVASQDIPVTSKDIPADIQMSSTEEMSTDAETEESSQVVSSQPSQIAGRGQFYSTRQSQGRRPMQRPTDRGNVTQEIKIPRPYSPWSPSARGRGRQIGASQPRRQKKRRNKEKRSMPMPLQLPPTTTTTDPIETEQATTEGNTQQPIQDGNKAELGGATEDPPPALTPLKFTKQQRPNQRPPPPVWEREPRPVTPSRAELYSRYTFKLDNDAISSRAHTAIPKTKKQPWDKGFAIIRGGPRRKSKDIEEIREKRKSNQEGGDVPPLLNKDK